MTLRTVRIAVVFASSCVALAACGTSAPPPNGPPCDSAVFTKVSSVDPGAPPEDKLSGVCIPMSPDITTEGTATCLVAAPSQSNGSCTCDAALGLAPLAPAHRAIIGQLQEEPAIQPFDCVCEVLQLTGSSLDACRTDTDPAPMDNGQPINGYCYVDSIAVPPIGNPSLMKNCPVESKRLLRLLGAAQAPPGNQLYFLCLADRCF